MVVRPCSSTPQPSGIVAALVARVEDLVDRDLAGGHVRVPDPVGRRRGERDRVGAERVVDAAVGDHERLGVRGRDADHARLGGADRVVARRRRSGSSGARRRRRRRGGARGRSRGRWRTRRPPGPGPRSASTSATAPCSRSIFGVGGGSWCPRAGPTSTPAGARRRASRCRGGWRRRARRRRSRRRRRRGPRPRAAPATSARARRGRSRSIEHLRVERVAQRLAGAAAAQVVDEEVDDARLLGRHQRDVVRA